MRKEIQLIKRVHRKEKVYEKKSQMLGFVK